MALEGMSGTEKAAIILMALGKERATAILKHMNTRDVNRVGAVMQELPSPSAETATNVMQHFLARAEQAGLGVDPGEYSKDLLKDALGDQVGGNDVDVYSLSDRLKSLEKLKWMHADTVAEMLKHEHPQTVAVVLSYMEHEQAANIIMGLPELLQKEALYRLSILDRISPEVLYDINDALEQNAQTDSSSVTGLGGAEAVAEILNYTTGNADKVILDSIGEQDAELRNAIEEKMFVFDDLIKIEDRSLQRLLRDIDNGVLIVALKGADPAFGDKVMKNMSQRAAEAFKEELEIAPPVKLSEVDEAQKQILATAKNLAEQNELMLPAKGSEEYV